MEGGRERKSTKGVSLVAYIAVMQAQFMYTIDHEYSSHLQSYLTQNRTANPTP